MDDLLREFITETNESLDVVDVELVKFEQEPNNATILDNIFRLVHTIKGTCGFLGLPRLEGIAHAAETLMGKFRDGAPVTQEAVSIILTSIDRIKEILADLEAIWRTQLLEVLLDGHTPVLHSSRGELTFASERQGRRFSQDLARLMARLAAAVTPELGYLISKGGITTQTLLSEGLGLDSVHLEGQLMPGLSVVRPSAGPLQGLPILTFPGNLGDATTLREAWQRMQAG